MMTWGPEIRLSYFSLNETVRHDVSRKVDAFVSDLRIADFSSSSAALTAVMLGRLDTSLIWKGQILGSSQIRVKAYI